MRRPVPPRRLALLAFALLALITACARREPEPMVLNEDQCAYCRMTISDARFGGEAILPSGRVKKFDSIECLLNWARVTPADQRGALFVIDAQHPGTFTPAEHAGFLLGALIKSPMGGAMVAFVDTVMAEQQRTVLGGTMRTWPQLLTDTSAAGLP